MQLKQIAKMQIEMDEKHGFPVHFDSLARKYEQLTKDLVGLFGEIGEFSNIVKKINIKVERPDGYEFDIDGGEQAMREELVDCLIYLIRLAAILDMDLQEEVLTKMRHNRTRYAKFEQR